MFITTDMIKKYTRQTSTPDDSIKFEKQISRQYSRQQSNPDATEETGKKEKKESEENKEEVWTPYLLCTTTSVLDAIFVMHDNISAVYDG